MYSVSFLPPRPATGTTLQELEHRTSGDAAAGTDVRSLKDAGGQ